MERHNNLLYQIAYNKDASHIQTNYEADVFLPKNKEDVMKSLETAINENKKIILRGWGTSLVGNCLPTNNSIIVDLSSVSWMQEPDGYSITLQPWVVLDDLNNFLKDYDMFFPVNIWSHLTAQIGGMISTNAAGMKEIKYWKVGDWVNWLNIAYIDKDKKVNTKILEWEDVLDFVSSEWILWVILEANLKLTSLPVQKSVSFEYFDDLSSLIEKSVYIKENFEISAMEFFNREVSEFLWLRREYCLLVEYEDDEVWQISDPEEIKQIWELRDSCYSVIVGNWYHQIEDPQINPSKVENLLSWFEQNQIPAFWHLGTGIIHPHFTPTQKWLVDEMYTMVKNLWGKVSGEHWIWIKKKKYLTNEYKKYYQTLKEKYDPLGFFGGENIL